LVGKGDDRVLLDQLMASLLGSLVHERDHRVLLHELLPLVQQGARGGPRTTGDVHGDAVPVGRHVVQTVSRRTTGLHVGHNRVLLGQRHLGAVAVLLAQGSPDPGGVAAGALLLDEELARAVRVLLEQHLLRSQHWLL